MLSCSLPESVLRVGTNVWPGYETLYLAREKEFFKYDEVRLIELLSATDVMAAIRNNSIEAAALTLDEAMTLVSEGVDIKVVMVMDISAGADALVVNEEINNLKQLRDKTIGYEQTAVGAVMLDGILKAGDLQVNQINTSHFTVDEHQAAFENGRVDAVITFEPVTSALLARGGKKLFDSSSIPGRIVDVLVIRSDAINGHRQGIAKLINSQFRALKHLQDYPAESARLMAPRLGVTADQVGDLFNGLVLPGRAGNLSMFSGEPSVISQTVTSLNTILLGSGLISERVQAPKLIDSSFIMSLRD